MKKTIGLIAQPWRKEKIEEFKQVIEKASELGFTELWSGIDKDTVNEVRSIASLTNKLGFYYFVDINPVVLENLGASPGNLSIFKKLGVQGVRADYGFDLDQLATMANNDLGLKVELNASVFPVDDLDDLLKMVRNTENLLASHDFYPWLHTGISLESAINKSREFHNRGMPVAIFISLKNGERTTVEHLRYLDIGVSANVLLNTRVIDRLLIGDPLPPYEEMHKVADALKHTKIRVKPYPGITEEETKVFGRDFYDVRVKETTVGLTASGNNKITPHNIVRRTRGSVTVINNNPDYIQVWVFKDDAPPDPRFNVIGEVIDEDMEIIDRIAERTRGTFRSLSREDLPPVTFEAVQ